MDSVVYPVHQWNLAFDSQLTWHPTVWEMAMLINVLIFEFVFWMLPKVVDTAADYVEHQLASADKYFVLILLVQRVERARPLASRLRDLQDFFMLSGDQLLKFRNNDDMIYQALFEFSASVSIAMLPIQ